eukprot:6210423-Pleurochrysis_carterae.AAC.2
MPGPRGRVTAPSSTRAACVLASREEQTRACASDAGRGIRPSVVLVVTAVRAVHAVWARRLLID